MTLPPEVLNLLGDDATPEMVAIKLSRQQKYRNSKALRLGMTLYGPRYATDAYVNAVAVAAIRECEARREFLFVSAVDPIAIAKWNTLKKAAADYDVLRNWRKA